MGKERDRGRERRRVQQTETEQTAPHLSVTYSVDTDIKTVVILWYAVDMAVYRLFSGLFLLRAISWCGENCKKKNWHMNTHTGHASRVASLVGLLFSKFYSVTTFFFFATGGCVSVWLLCLHALWSALLEHKRTTGNDWGCCSAWFGVNEALCLFFIYCYPIVSFQCI